MSAKTILVVEDDADSLAVIKWTLESRGHVCLLASSLAEATAHLTANTAQIACVVLDFFLPDGDGMVFGGQLSANTAGYKVPLIGITAFYTPELREKALGMGFDVCLPKPFEMDNFVATVKRLLG